MTGSSPENEKAEFAPPESSPAGSTCHRHEDRGALLRCPQCGKDCCLTCWHHAIRRCQGCIQQDPTLGLPPIAWEQPELPFHRRLLGTLATAFRPATSAPLMTRPGVAAALQFALLTALPLSALRGVIPLTTTLRFGGSFQVALIGNPSTLDVAVDVLTAMCMSVAVTAVSIAVLAVPFVSLARAYGTVAGHHGAVRMILYRAWLIPLTTGGLLLWVGAWAIPGGLEHSAISLLATLEMIPLLMFLMAMRSTARLSHGVGLFPSFVVILIPVVVLVLVQMISAPALEALLPAGAADATPGAP